MLKQEKRTKPSSGEKRLLAELKTARPGTLDALEISLRAPRPDLIAVSERQLVRLRKEFLVELVNASDGIGIDKIQRRVETFFRLEPDGIVEKFRDSLRQIWSPATPLPQKQKIVDAWFNSGFRNPERPGLRIALEVERLVLDQSNFRLQLCLGVMENWRKFRTCKNPKCPNRYFLADRSTRSVCDRPECKSYVQNAYALAYWNREGKRRRKRKQLRLSRKSAS
jgi:hypothetical protein